MDALLIVVTLVSLTFAVIVLVLNWRLIREERRRSAARVEALSEAVFSPVPDAARDTVEPSVISSHELFHEAAEPVSGFGRLVLPASLGVVIVSVILVGLVMWNRGPAKPTPPAAAVAARNPASIPLELISLRHERTADGLSISGLVRNPAGGQRISDVNVVVFLFDRAGALVTSVKGPLDFRTLAPGDESPFTIALNKIGTIGRYRVSFRTDDKVVPHVDRRQEPAAVATGFGAPGQSGTRSPAAAAAGFGAPTKLEERSRVVAVASTR